MPTVTISTSHKHQLIDITDEVEEIVKKSNIQKGICVLYVPHATGGITINENADPNITKDIIKAVNKIVPEHDNYLHDAIDNNAAAHIKSTLTGVSKSIPIRSSRLMLGTWQNIFVTEWDGPRDSRKIMVELLKIQ